MHPQGKNTHFYPSLQHVYQQLPPSQSLLSTIPPLQSARPISRQNTHQREGCILQEMQTSIFERLCFLKMEIEDTKRNVLGWICERSSLLRTYFSVF